MLIIPLSKHGCTGISKGCQLVTEVVTAYIVDPIWRDPQVYGMVANWLLQKSQYPSMILYSMQGSTGISHHCQLVIVVVMTYIDYQNYAL